MSEIDAAMAVTKRDHAWLHRKSRSAFFSGKTPIEHMVEQGEVGLADVLRELNRGALKATLSGQLRS